MKYKGIIFDLDGTLLDTLEDLADAVNFVLRKRKYKEHTLEEIREYVGNGVRKLIERSVPENTPEEETEEILSEFVKYYSKNSRVKTKPYPGITGMLENLKNNGCKIAVVSNKFDYAVKALCGYFFEGLYDTAKGETENVRKKPCPDMVFKAVEELGLEVSDCVYIGDSEVDIETARNSRMDLISVTWGFRDRQTLLENGAETFAGKPSDILEIINGK